MTNYLKKFRLDKKLSYIIGSEGLIGEKIVEIFLSAGSEVVCLDKKVNKKKSA